MNLLLFAGTTEGRELAQELLRRFPAEIYVCVATEYGEQLLPEHPRLHRQTGRMDGSAIRDFIRKIQPACVLDATHPYAREVTRNIQQACQETAVPLLRVIRSSSSPAQAEVVPSVEEAVRLLRQTQGHILLTTGSKDLAAFTQIEDYPERVFARILPSAENIRQAQALGFRGSHLICMQGPFSVEFNAALLRQIQADWMVTKDSGKPGGTEEKLEAAAVAGVRTILIGRPEEPSVPALPMEEVLPFLERQYLPPAPYFPLFQNLRGRKVIVFGAGTIAQRRIHALLPFGCHMTVIAPKAVSPLPDTVRWECRPYHPGDCKGADLVLAATNQREVNHAVFEECEEYGIPVNVADCKEECRFYFPGLVREGDLVIGVTSSGTDPAQVKHTVQRIREMLQKEGRP